MAVPLELRNFLKSLEGYELKTLARSASFKVLTLENDLLGIRLGSSGREYSLPLENMVVYWNTLCSTGQLKHSDIFPNDHNSAYFVAMLSKYKDVTYNVTPTILFYKK
jgi:hypothetical protein